MRISNDERSELGGIGQISHLFQDQVSEWTVTSIWRLDKRTSPSSSIVEKILIYRSKMNHSSLNVKMTPESNLVKTNSKNSIKHIGNGVKSSIMQKKESSFINRLEKCWVDSKGVVFSF